ncbi:MAG TPA: type II toxin-antitoxin system VapC family toxin [Actinomycetota bacterium]|nr:type II toxin-antitoxin system VapC family toxin [Actinomycetota bacterium]
MRYLLDTVVLIWAVRGLREAPRVLRLLRGRGDLAVASITLLELRRALLPEEFRRAEEELEGMRVLPLDAATARAAGDYLVRCAEEGYRIDFFAGIIQATAARAGRALVTYGPHHYPLADCEIVPLAELVGTADGADPRGPGRDPGSGR